MSVGSNGRQNRSSQDDKSKRRKNRRKRRYKKKRRKFRKLIVEKEIEITRMIEKKQEKEKDLIEIRTMEEMVLTRFHKYLKVFEKKVRENANKEDMTLCYRSQRRFCSEKGGNISVIKNRERRDLSVFEELVKEEVYLTIEITTGITHILCAKEGWKEENGTRLLIFELLDNQEQLSIATNFRFNK